MLGPPPLQKPPFAAIAWHEHSGTLDWVVEWVVSKFKMKHWNVLFLVPDCLKSWKRDVFGDAHVSVSLIVQLSKALLHSQEVWTLRWLRVLPVPRGSHARRTPSRLRPSGPEGEAHRNGVDQHKAKESARHASWVVSENITPAALCDFSPNLHKRKKPAWPAMAVAIEPRHLRCTENWAHNIDLSLRYSITLIRIQHCLHGNDDNDDKENIGESQNPNTAWLLARLQDHMCVNSTETERGAAGFSWFQGPRRFCTFSALKRRAFEVKKTQKVF